MNTTKPNKTRLIWRRVA